MCKLFVADLLVGLEECCTQVVDHKELVVLFDEAMFSSFKEKRTSLAMFPFDRPFLEQLMRTQCFSLCISGCILKKLNPDSRPNSRPSSPFVSIPQSLAALKFSAMPTTPTQWS